MSVCLYWPQHKKWFCMYFLELRRGCSLLKVGLKGVIISMFFRISWINRVLPLPGEVAIKHCNFHGTNLFGLVCLTQCFPGCTTIYIQCNVCSFLTDWRCIRSRYIHGLLFPTVYFWNLCLTCTWIVSFTGQESGCSWKGKPTSPISPHFIIVKNIALLWVSYLQVCNSYVPRDEKIPDTLTNLEI